MDLFMRLLVSGVVLGSIYSLIALGYSLIYKASGLMSFVQGDILTLGAYLGLTFYRIMKWPFSVSVILTVVITFFVGILLERGVIRRLLKRKVNVIYIVLATIAISYIIQNGAQLTWGSTTEYFPSVFKEESVKVLGVSVQTASVMCFIVSLISMLLLHFFLTKTRFGTNMRASSMDRMAAESCGINVSLTTGVTWGISAALAAIAGILIGPMYGVYTTLGASIARRGFSGAVIGGYGNVYGAMIGGLLLGLCETMVAGYISSELKNMIAFIILIVFLFLKPTGIFNERAIQDV